LKVVNKKKTIIVIFFLFCVNFFQNNPCSAFSGTYDLTYGDYVAVHSSNSYGPPTYVEWSFEGNNEYIGIKVYLMTETNYYSWISGGTVPVFVLSNGDYYSDYGTFDLQTNDVWCVVFFVDDVDAIFDYTTVYISVNFRELILPGGYGYESGLAPWLLSIIIIIPLMITIGIITIVVLVIKKKKQNKIIEDTTPIDASNQVSSSHQQLNQEPQKQMLYCPNCGKEYIASNANFCVVCGTKLLRK